MGPGVAVGLVVLAIAQMGVHLVFFLHITSGPDNTNNVLALAFGVLIVFLVMIGTIWIMAHMNANMSVDPEHDEPADAARLEPGPGKGDATAARRTLAAIASAADQALAPCISERDPDLHRHVDDDRPGNGDCRERGRNRVAGGSPPKRDDGNVDVHAADDQQQDGDAALAEAALRPKRAPTAATATKATKPSAGSSAIGLPGGLGASALGALR